MSKVVIILLVTMMLFSCKKNQNLQEITNAETKVIETNQNIQETKNAEAQVIEKKETEKSFSLNEDSLDKVSKEGLGIWKLIVNQDFEELSDFIDEEAGLMISTEAIFNPTLDFTISKEEVAKINEDNTIHDLYFSAPGIFFPYTNKKVFDQFFSFQLSRVSEIKTNAIVERDYIYEDYSIPILLSPFPKDSELVDVFIEPELEGSSDWYHIFLVIRYVDEKAFLYGLGIAYMDF